MYKSIARKLTSYHSYGIILRYENCRLRVYSYKERCQSGRMYLSRKQVPCKGPGVQIPLSPPSVC